MSFLLTPDLLQKLQATLAQDALAFLPELLLVGGIIAMLLGRMCSALDRVSMAWVALAVTLAGLYVSFGQWFGCCFTPRNVGDIFHGLLVYDSFTVFLRLFLFSFTALVIWLSILTGIPDREDSADFYTLLLGAVVGMSQMAAANHLLMVFIAVEMASLPSFALAGFLKGKRQSSEAALKYVVYGGGAAGIMIYGISLIAGKFGTGYLPDLARVVPEAAAAFDPIVLLGMLFIFIGFAFKLSAVPFHFWCPDVFEGAAAEVAGFLSVASKGAALALTARFALLLGVGPTANFLIPALAFFAALTATFGNLAAYSQTNLKRLLAYSTIAHAGYMMMGLAAMNTAGVSAVLFYLVVYLFMNLGAFAIVAFLRNQTGSEDLASFKGLIYKSPVLVVTLAIFLLSLLGMPPLAGFAAKFQIFQVLYNAGQTYSAAGAPGLGNIMYALLVIGGINSVISLVYYVKVLKVMIIERPEEESVGKPVEEMPAPFGVALYSTLLAGMVLVLGILWNPLAVASDRGVASLRPPAASAPVAQGPGARTEVQP